MVSRNINGKALEKQGREKEAVRLYEQNIAEGFDGTYPYRRLRVIYSRQKDYRNAIRVCETYLRHPKARKKQEFRQHLTKLQAKL